MNRKIRKLFRSPKQYFLDSKLFRLLRFGVKTNKGLTNLKRNPELIVSLTTFPARQDYAAKTINSILNQTLRADRIIVWLAEDECQGKIIPPSLKCFLTEGVEFRFVKESLRSYQKLIFTIEEHPHAVIITVDDDVLYREDMVEKLFLNYIKNPKVISCHRAHLIKLDENKVYPYKEWKMRISDHKPSYLHLATGVGGVLYPPYCLFPDIKNIEKIKKLAPTCDDLWFWAMEVLNGFKVQVVEGNNSKLQYVPGSQVVGKGGENQLHNNNVEAGWNDIQLRNILNEYKDLIDIATEKKRKNYLEIFSGSPKTIKEIINIAFICDSNYLMPTAVAINSLKLNRNKSNKYRIHVLCSGVSVEDKDKIKELQAENFEVIPLEFSAEELTYLHDGPRAKNLSASVAALEKFNLPDILKINKVLYLDSDIIIRKDLAELYELDISNVYAAVTFDTGLMYSQRIQNINPRSYFNSGVMLLNLKKLREDNMPRKLIEIKSQYADKSLMDQNVFNEVFKNCVKFVSIKYNLLYVNLLRAKEKYTINQINSLFNSKYKNLTDIRKDCVIIHFSSKDKPWKDQDVPLKEEWLGYYRKTNFK